MFDNMGDMAKMLSNMQENAQKMDEQLASKTFTITSGAQMIEITGNGKGEITDIKLDDSLLDNKETLEILLISAINDLAKMVEQNKQNNAMNALGSINPFANAK